MKPINFKNAELIDINTEINDVYEYQDTVSDSNSREVKDVNITVMHHNKKLNIQLKSTDGIAYYSASVLFDNESHLIPLISGIIDHGITDMTIGEFVTKLLAESHSIYGANIIINKTKYILFSQTKMAVAKINHELTWKPVGLNEYHDSELVSIQDIINHIISEL